MSKSKFIKLLMRNFSEDDTVWIGVNKKFHNEKTGNKFARDFEQQKYKLSLLPNMIKQLREKYDLYVSFTPTGGKDRLKVNAQDSYIIAMDIDGVPIPEDLPPSYYWETSPDKYQGVWVLDNKVTPAEQEELNRKLIHKYGFDKTSADVVHFYRVPSTYNHKYASTFKVSGMQGQGTVYRKKEFMKALKNVVPPVFIGGDIATEEIPTVRYDLEDLVDKFNLENSYKKTSGIDRSSWSWHIGKQMFDKGCTKEELKFILLNAPAEMSKFNFKTVDSEVHRLFHKFSNGEEEDEDLIIEDTPKLKKKVKKVDTKELKQKGQSTRNPINVIRVDEIEPYDETDFWLVEDFWQNESVGIIGAPSKAFKSTLTLNLACAIATGMPFDGRKVKQGGVLIVQGENSLSIEQHKIYSITGRTDLPIFFVDSVWDMTKAYKLKDTIIELGIKLLIIDPMYLLFGNGDINRHQDITDRLSLLSRLRDDTGCSIMLVHHSRKLERGAKIQTSDMYGSAFIEGWYESMILMQRSGVQTSRMTTYFRNHKSGDVYTLLVNDNMGCKVIKDRGESDYGETPEASFDSIMPKEKKEK